MGMYKRYKEICENLGVKDCDMKSLQRGRGLSAKRAKAILTMSGEGYGIPELTTLFNRTPVVLSCLIKYNIKKDKTKKKDQGILLIKLPKGNVSG